MDLNRAAIFAKVIEARGFSAAARLLGVPKTTVSKNVSDLEAELGVRLLNRTTRTVSPTEAGERAYHHIVEALRHMEEAEQQVRAAQREPTGILTVAAPGAVGVPFLLPALIAFMDRHPAVAVSLLSVDEPISLANSHVDVMVWPGLDCPAGHVIRLVTQVEMSLYASPEYLADHPAIAQPSDLSSHDVVAFIQSMIGGRFKWQLQKGHTQVVVDPGSQPRFISNDPIALLAAVRAGQGIGILPNRFVAEMPNAAALVQILPEWHPRPIPLNAIFRDGAASSAKTRLFLDSVAAWFRD